MQMKPVGIDSKVLTVSMTALKNGAKEDFFFDAATFGSRFFYK